MIPAKVAVLVERLLSHDSLPLTAPNIEMTNIAEDIHETSFNEVSASDTLVEVREEPAPLPMCQSHSP